MPALDIIRNTPGLAGRVSTSAQWLQAASDHDVLPVGVGWGDLLPNGALQRGRVHLCRGEGARSLALSLVGRAVAEGSWLAAVDLDDLGYGALTDAGIALERIVNVDSGAAPARVICTLCEGFDVIVAGLFACSLRESRQVSTRLLAQRAVLVLVDERDGADREHIGPVADVVLTGRGESWLFDSHARRRTLTVDSAGRRVHPAKSCELIVPAEATGERDR